jgi:nucleoside-diphosphate-sugar epimerase
MRFTVIGAGGFIGSHLANRLLQLGHDVVAIGRDQRSAFERPLGHVFYCIGLTADFRSRPFDTVEAHVTVLADILRKAKFDSLTYLSSTRVYSGSPRGFEDLPLRVSAHDPSDLYNLSKLMGESLCLNCGRQNVRVVRLSNVIGSDAGSENFVFDIARSALSGHVRLRSDPDSAKDYIHVDDVVQVLELIAVKGRHRIYNLASGQKVTHGTWLKKLSELTGCTTEVQAGAPRVDFPDVDIELLTSEFGFRPRPVLEELPEILNFLKTSRAHEAKQ